MASFDHPLSTTLGAPPDRRARAVLRFDQPLAAKQVVSAHDRRPADAEFLGESTLRRQTRTRPQPAADDRGAQLLRNVFIARTRSRPAVAPHLQAYAAHDGADPRGKPVSLFRRMVPG